MIRLNVTRRNVVSSVVNSGAQSNVNAQVYVSTEFRF